MNWAEWFAQMAQDIDWSSYPPAEVSRLAWNAAVAYRDGQWIKHATVIRNEGVENFANPMLALSARVTLEDMTTNDT
jgi:Fe-S cluster biosynthesis and repair protein YggX